MCSNGPKWRMLAGTGSVALYMIATSKWRQTYEALVVAVARRHGEIKNDGERNKGDRARLPVPRHLVGERRKHTALRHLSNAFNSYIVGIASGVHL